MRFLISGMPRCRTAWLTALLHAHGAKPKHDIFTQGYTARSYDQIVDPAIAMLTPLEGLAAFPEVTIAVHADSMEDRLTALGKAAGVEFSEVSREVYTRNVEEFTSKADVRVHVKDLEDNDTVGEIIKLCTKQAPSSHTISTFQLLKIEEHMEKASQLNSRITRSTSKELWKNLIAIQSGTSTAPGGSFTPRPRTAR